MKNILTFFYLFSTVVIFAQAPQKFNYQAVARNTQGAVLANQSIKIRASILDGSANGSSQYSESHSITSNSLGLFTLAIGGGNAVSGKFTDITWSSGDKYLKIEMDATGGNNYTLMGTSQLLSVPYALNAGNGSQWKDGVNGIHYSNGKVGISTSDPKGLFEVSGGDNATIFTKPQISLSWQGGGFRHWIHTRHNASSKLNNAIDFYLNDGGSMETSIGPNKGSVLGLTISNADEGASIGIGTSDIPARLSFENRVGDKVSFWNDLSLNNGIYGIGVQSSQLQIYSPNSTSDISFGYGTSNKFSETVRIKGNGNVGIGTKSPTQKLEIAGTLKANSIVLTSGAASGKVLTSDASGNATWQSPSNGGGSQWSTSGSDIKFTNGKVIIGNVNIPGGYRMYVEEGILTERVKVAIKSTAYWADYVFEKNYNLKKLSEVEKFIQKHGHLPNIPSAKQVVENGIDIGEMNAKLLEKIEELTLHAINQQKSIDKLNFELIEIKSKMK